MNIDKKFILTKGMHAGKTIAEVESTNPSYIEWAKKNAPNLLRGKNKEIPKKELESNNSNGKLQPNLDFLNQKNQK